MTAATEVRRGVGTPLLVGGLVAAATLVVALRDPHEGGYPLCPVLALTGYYCAGCGGLRSAHDLATGDVAGAWGMNPFFTIAMPVAAVLWLIWLVRAATDRPAWQPPAWSVIAFLALAIVFSVLRNVPALHGVLGPV
ncbi:DUF2752 domain-containing protein [Pseudactinotalea terrae]|uniref:DUF2752 domain-containing protein n=1 Tax=Pseudactinotalea terrae TaxID=1743262 RepID=UPI0012E25FFB|nr:DUF2752 domain-containing protein [Pseudactinotalea terrae]